MLHLCTSKNLIAPKLGCNICETIPLSRRVINVSNLRNKPPIHDLAAEAGSFHSSSSRQEILFIMTLQDLAPELVHQIYNTLSTVSDVINLSLTCHRLNTLLRNAQKLSTLFAAADREFGPVHDIKMLVTYNNALPAHGKRDPSMSYALLRQTIVIGTVGKRVEALYPSIRWHDDFINRRTLTHPEARRVRQAVYRYWLYAEAFHNRHHPRTHRLHPSIVEERCQLLRCWSTEALIDIEDIRLIMEDILTDQICPTDGTVQQRLGKDSFFNAWQFVPHTYPPAAARSDYMQQYFHGSRDDSNRNLSCSAVAHTRATKMEGWGDDISQYYYVQSLLKLNPAQVLWLYDNATYRYQVENLVRELGEEWFWNNGQTLQDTWTRVMHARGEDAEEIRRNIYDCESGIGVNGGEEHSDVCQ